jgi:MtfA peptidase
MPHFDFLYLIALLFVGFFTYKIFSKAFGLIIISPANAKRMHNFYTIHSHYYNCLEPKLQKRFVYRAFSLINRFRFIGRQGFQVTEQVKLLVVSAMVQLTFGFKRYSLGRFKTVFVYPDSYLNPFTGKIHDGEVHPRGLIVLSWKKLVRGFADPNDRINLGLHELAHALMHTILSSNDHEKGLNEYLEKVIKLSKEDIEKINNGSSHIFRSYAGSNVDEFFAVAIEHFFEDPKEFSASLPDLYRKLTQLLKQDPARKIYVLS